MSVVMATATKFSTVYNAGRMFHARNDIHSCSNDGPVSEELRRLFARAHCRAVGVPIPGLGKANLFAIETEIRRLAPSIALTWNDLRALDAYEPAEVVDDFLRTLSWPAAKLAAIHRQAERWRRKQDARKEKICLRIKPQPVATRTSIFRELTPTSACDR